MLVRFCGEKFQNAEQISPMHTKRDLDHGTRLSRLDEAAVVQMLERFFGGVVCRDEVEDGTVVDLSSHALFMKRSWFNKV